MEWKVDGFRAIACVENEAKLVSRNLKSLPFESLRASLAKLPVTNAILDGEIVCLDADLRRTPLYERKARLAELVRVSNCPRLLYAQHVEGAGKELFAEIRRRGLEGIVAKRKTGVYREDRQDWPQGQEPDL